MPLAPDPWLDLDAAKNHLNIPLSVETDDVELTEFLRRAEGAIAGKVGHVKLRTVAVVARRRGGGPTVRVDDELPIGEVTEVSVQGTLIPAANLDTGAAGWYLEDEVDRKVGIIRHSADRFPSGFVKVTYKPGRNPIPPDLEHASLELLRYLWKTQRGPLTTRPGLRGEGVDPAEAGPRGGDRTPTGFTFPKRVMELLTPYLVPAAG